MHWVAHPLAVLQVLTVHITGLGAAQFPTPSQVPAPVNVLVAHEASLHCVP
jgi:hypothetical protein